MLVMVFSNEASANVRNPLLPVLEVPWRLKKIKLVTCSFQFASQNLHDLEQDRPLIKHMRNSDLGVHRWKITENIKPQANSFKVFLRYKLLTLQLLWMFLKSIFLIIFNSCLIYSTLSPTQNTLNTLQKIPQGTYYAVCLLLMAFVFI